MAVVEQDLSDHLAAQFLAADAVAWDIETTGLDWSVDRIGTCQLYMPALGAVIVHKLVTRPERLCRLLEAPRPLKVFHHAPFDLRFMIGHWNVSPRAIACTKVASRLLSPDLPTDEHSLKPLARRLLGVALDKSQQVSDWTADQLSEQQLHYAAEDVRYLATLLQALEGRLAAKGLLDLYRRCCEFLPTRAQLDVGRWPDVFAY